MGALSFQNVTKRFGEAVAVEDATLDAAQGEFVVLVGPSGCGKTTLLRLTAGLETPTSGEIFMDNRPLVNLPPRERDVAMVFQDYALYPHMTVFENMAFGLMARKMPKSEIRGRVEKVAQTLGLARLLRRTPRALSGGQRQRVAMGRAIVREPEVFLFDEPLSNLDFKLRVQMRSEIRSLCKNLGTTALYVTHDQVEAMTMADRIVVMHEGRVQQIGPPEEVYARPANRFVAGFIGSPPMNFFHGRVEPGAGGARLKGEGGEEGGGVLDLPQSLARRIPEGMGEIWLGVRPEAFSLAPGEALGEGGGEGGGENLGDGAPFLQVQGRLKASELLGRERILVLDTDFGTVEVVVAPETVVGGAVAVRAEGEKVHVFAE